MIRVTKKQSKKPATLTDDIEFIINKNLPVIVKEFGSQVDRNTMLRLALKTFRNNPNLLKCDKLSVIKSILEAVHLGLSIDDPLGEAYIVPYKNQATMIVGYRGFIKLAKRTDKVEHIEARIVYEKDEFLVEYGTNPKIHHIPYSGDDPGEKIAAYAVALLKGGVRIFELLWKREIEKIKKIALENKQNIEASPWIRFEDEMWKKTAIRRLVKYLSLSSEATKAAVADEYREAGFEVSVLDIEEETPEKIEEEIKKKSEKNTENEEKKEGEGQKSDNKGDIQDISDILKGVKK